MRDMSGLETNDTLEKYYDKTGRLPTVPTPSDNRTYCTGSECGRKLECIRYIGHLNLSKSDVHWWVETTDCIGSGYDCFLIKVDNKSLKVFK